MEISEYTCEEARIDIDVFFMGVRTRYGQLAQDRALAHMTAGTTLGHHNISCQPCWDYYMEMKRKHCGG